MNQVQMINAPLGILIVGNMPDGMTVLTYCGCALRGDQIIQLFTNRE